MAQTKAQTLAAIKAIGRELTARCTDGEWRVSIAIPAIQMVNGCGYSTARERNEAIAAYCGDPVEAVANATQLHNWYVNSSAKGI